MQPSQVQRPDLGPKGGQKLCRAGGQGRGSGLLSGAWREAVRQAGNLPSGPLSGRLRRDPDALPCVAAPGGGLRAGWALGDHTPP